MWLVTGTSAWCLSKPRHCDTPSGALTSPGVWMFALFEHAPLHVLVVPGLDLSPLHFYISTIYSLRPQGPCLFFLSVFSVRIGYEPGALKKSKELLVSLDAIRVGQVRDSYIRVLYLILKNSIWSISLFTNTILNLYDLSVAVPGFCLRGTWFFFKMLWNIKYQKICRLLQSKI